MQKFSKKQHHHLSELAQGGAELALDVVFGGAKAGGYFVVAQTFGATQAPYVAALSGHLVDGHLDEKRRFAGYDLILGGAVESLGRAVCGAGIIRAHELSAQEIEGGIARHGVQKRAQRALGGY